MRVRSTLCADSVFVFSLLSDLLRITSHVGHSDAMFVNEFSDSLSLVEKRARRDHRDNQEGYPGAFKAAR
jgi:hypothetical protein